MGPLVLFCMYGVLGFLLYAVLYAAAGSLVSRQEDVNGAVMPMTMVTMAGYLVAVYSGTGLLDVRAGWVALLSQIPFISPFIMPTRIVRGDVAGWEVALSIGILFATIPWPSGSLLACTPQAYSCTDSDRIARPSGGWCGRPVEMTADSVIRGSPWCLQVRLFSWLGRTSGAESAAGRSVESRCGRKSRRPRRDPPADHFDKAVSAPQYQPSIRARGRQGAIDGEGGGKIRCEPFQLECLAPDLRGCRSSGAVSCSVESWLSWPSWCWP